MTYIHFIKLFILTLILLFILDMIWINIIAKNFYLEYLGNRLIRPEQLRFINIFSIAAVYVLFVLGILFFVLPKANDSYFKSAFWGGIFGVVTYGIYEFTNAAILFNWPIKIIGVDIAWGITLCALTSLFSMYFKNNIINLIKTSNR